MTYRQVECGALSPGRHLRRDRLGRLPVPRRRQHDLLGGDERREDRLQGEGHLQKERLFGGDARVRRRPRQDIARGIRQGRAHHPARLRGMLLPGRAADLASLQSKGQIGLVTFVSVCPPKNIDKGSRLCHGQIRKYVFTVFVLSFQHAEGASVKTDGSETNASVLSRTLRPLAAARKRTDRSAWTGDPVSADRVSVTRDSSETTVSVQRKR